MILRAFVMAVSSTGLIEPAQWVAEPPRAAVLLPNNDLADFAGIYPYRHSWCGTCGSKQLEVQSDGAVRHVRVSTDSTSAVTGRATLTQGLLAIRWEEAESPRGQSEEEFHAVRWGERRYLLRDRDSEGFCQAIDWGVEPRSEADGEPMMRDGDEGRVARDLPELPSELLATLRARPVEGRIAEVAGADAWIELTSDAAPRKGELLFGYGEPAEEADLRPFEVVVVEVVGQRARVGWVGLGTSRLAVGQWVSSRYAFNRWAFPLELRAVQVNSVRKLEWVGPFVLETAFLTPEPGGDDRHAGWLSAAQRMIGSGQSRQPEAKLELDRAPIAELTPALLNAALLIPVDQADTLGQVAILVAYWDERQMHVHPLDFDGDAMRRTPQAQGERLQALHDWAEWWRATAADPEALSSWTAALSQAGGH